MKKYTMKAFEVEAEIWNFGDPPMKCMIPYDTDEPDLAGYYYVRQGSVAHHVASGDYIVNGVVGGGPDYYVSKPEAFELVYDEVKRQNRGRVKMDENEESGQWTVTIVGANGEPVTSGYGYNDLETAQENLEATAFLAQKGNHRLFINGVFQDEANGD